MPPSPILGPPPAAAPQWGLKRRAVIVTAKYLAPLLINGLGATLRVELPAGLPPELSAQPPRPAIYAFWHCDLLPIAWYMRRRGIGILVSQHFDGEWIAQAARRMGYVIFRGSSTRGGLGALTEMARAVRAGTPVAFTADGPRGPRFVAKPGPALLAQLTGAPLYAIHARMPNAYQLHSWDRLQIPHPFSRAIGSWAGPFHVPAQADRQEIEAQRLRLEAALNGLRAQ
ncbi:MAG: lysophospholipid acyltransferase family protein [Terriglobales bacterium]